MLSELVRIFAGTHAASESGQLLAALAANAEIKMEGRARQARELLAQARDDYRSEQFLCCLDRCERLTTYYADLPESTEGMELASKIKNNPEWLQQACDSLADRLGGLYLALAESYVRKGEPERAAVQLERVIQSFPRTPQAQAARLRLSYLQGQQTWQAEFNKPMKDSAP